MINKYISLLILLNSIALITSCTSYEHVYDGPHTLSGSAMPDKVKNDTDTKLDGKPGIEVGIVSSVNNGKHEVIVHQKKVIDLGSVVYVIIGNKEIFMTVSFPMLSSFKCLVVPNQSQYVKDIKKGMTVYIKE